MPLVFDVRLCCDACGNEQTSAAFLEPTLVGLVSGNPRSLFRFSYNQASGFSWKFFGETTGCSPVCHEALEAAQKSKNDPQSG